MHVELATCPCSWGIFWPDGSPSYVPADTFLDQVAQAGYEALELGPVGYLPTDRRALRDALSRRGLRARAGTACYCIDEMASFEDVRAQAASLCALLKSFEVEYLVMMDESPDARDPANKARFSPERIHKNWGIIRDYVSFAKQYGVTVAYHPHLGSIIETEKEILDLLDKTDCMLCLDTGHHQAVNGLPVRGDRCAIDFLLAHRDRISLLHLKNVNADAMRRYMAHPEIEQDDLFCPLEDGIIDFTALKDALCQANFRGIAVVEQDMAGKPALESYRLAVRNRQYLRSAGIV